MKISNIVLIWLLAFVLVMSICGFDTKKAVVLVTILVGICVVALKKL